MKKFYTTQDLADLRGLFNDKAKRIAENGKPNYILLSGGIDSVTALYAFIDAGVPYTAVNFYVNGVESSDTAKCKKLQQQGDFNIQYIGIAGDWEHMKEDVRRSVHLCRKIYNRIRAVKCETIYAMLQLQRQLPKDVNIISGIGGDTLCAWRKTEGMIITALGEDDKDSLAIRQIDEKSDELAFIFSEPDYSYYDFFDGEIQDFVLKYTTKACNRKKPKSIFAYTYYDYHSKYKSYAKPKGYHKASGLNVLFGDIAKSQDYKTALELFKETEKNERQHSG